MSPWWRRVVPRLSLFPAAQHLSVTKKGCRCEARYGFTHTELRYDIGRTLFGKAANDVILPIWWWRVVLRLALFPVAQHLSVTKKGCRCEARYGFAHTELRYDIGRTLFGKAAIDVILPHLVAESGA